MIIEFDNKDRIRRCRRSSSVEAFDAVEVIYITARGMRFGSPYFLAWLRQMRVERIPRLRAFHLHTNAQLWNHACGTHRAEVRAFIKLPESRSMLRARPPMPINRRGGTRDRL